MNNLMDLAADLGRIRKERAAYYLWCRQMHKQTVGDSTEAADEKYIEELTLAEARYEIALAFLKGDIRVNPHPDPDREPSDAGADEEGPDKDCAD